MNKLFKKLINNWEKLSLIFFGFLVFSKSIFNGFVIDDFEVIVNNKLVQSPGNFFQFFQGGAFSRGSASILYGQHYRPVMLAAFSVIYNFFGANPFYFHFFQLIVFILNSIFVYLLFCRFFGKKLSFVFSVIFLIHPINLIPAVFIGSIGDTLFMFFGLLTILMVVYKKAFNLLDLLLIVILLLLSVLSKETGVLFLIATLMAAWFFQKKYFWMIFLSTSVSGSIYLYLRIFVANSQIFINSFAPIQKATFFEKIQSVPAILSYYFLHTIYPWNLSMFQHWVIKDPNLNNFFLPLLLILLVFVTLLVLIKRSINNTNFNEIIFFSLWLLLGCVFVLPFWPTDMTVSDRWFYFPFVGLFGVIGFLVQSWKIKNNNVIVLLVLVFVSLLAVRTYIRSGDWKNNLVLAARDIKYSPDSFELQNLYGIELAKSGKLNEGEAYLKKSVDNLAYGVNLNNLASVYLAKGETNLAIDTFKKSASFGYYKAYENLSSLYMFNKETDFAISETKSFLEKFPNNPKLWQILALSELKKGNYKEAMVDATKYLRLSKSRDAFNLLNDIKAGKSYEEILNTKN